MQGKQIVDEREKWRVGTDGSAETTHGWKCNTKQHLRIHDAKEDNVRTFSFLLTRIGMERWNEFWKGGRRNKCN